ncbi:MAG: alpha/beta hydrolase [Arachnia sp.]
MRGFVVEMNPDRGVTLEAVLFDPPLASEQPSCLEHPRPLIILCPGGGYQFCSQREADPIAVGFLRHGFNALILRYSLREHSAYPHPLIDASRAVRWARVHAGELGIDARRIALCGFSAGGHVAALLGTQWNDPDLPSAEQAEYEALAARGYPANAGLMAAQNRPDALVLSYAALRLDWDPGDTPIQAEAAIRRQRHPARDTLARVGPHTPPSFLWTTGQDATVPPGDSLAFAAALAEHGVGFELHHFGYGGHGLGTGERLSNQDKGQLPVNVDGWLGLAADWLRATL